MKVYEIGKKYGYLLYQDGDVKKLYILKDSLKMKKMIKIILQKFGSTIGSNIVCQ